MLSNLFILAGGAGSRMGRDKLQLRDAAGRLLILDWFEQLNWPASPWLVLPPSAQAPAELAMWPVTHDAIGGGGPLQGVASALAAAKSDWLVITAVDTPGIGREQLDFLLARRQTDPAARLWMMRRPDGIEPFPLLIHRDMAPAVAARLTSARRSVHGLADEPAARTVPAPSNWPVAVWSNLNRPEDLQHYLRPPVSSPGTPGEG